MKRRPTRAPRTSWEPLPAPEEPAAEVAELLDRLHVFRQHLDDAARQVHMLEQTVREVGDELPPGSRTYYRIESQVARNRVTLWSRQVVQLERAARAMGLQP